MFCKFCGAEIADNSNFCAYCGTAGAPAAQPQTENPAPYTPAQQVDYPTTILDNAPAYTPVQPAEPVAQPAPAQVYTPAVNPMTQPAPEAQFDFSQPQVNLNLDEKAFFDTYATKKTKSYYKAVTIIAFITATISIVPLAVGNFFSIIDLLFYLVLGILLLKKRNWILPLCLAIYSGIGTIIGMAMSGTATGIVALVTAIIATKAAKEVSDAYKQYKTTGALPTQLIGKQ